MRARLIAARAVLASLIVFPCGLSAAEPNLPASDATPAELVTAALRTELDGPSELRKTLLEKALKLDANFAPARWQLGYVRWDDQWLTLDEVAQRAAGDTRVAEYRRRRDAMIDTADSQRELARWCKKNHLTEQAGVHWAKVLEFDPQDAEALAALELQFFEGRLLTREQVAEAKQQNALRWQAMKRWQPRMAKWRNGIEIGRGIKYVEATEALTSLNDVEALDALESVFADNGAGQHADQLNMLLIETVGRMPDPEATQILLRRALLAKSDDVALAAAAALSRRPMYSYVPQLISCLPNRVKSRFHVTVTPTGSVIHEHELSVESPQGTTALNYESLVHSADLAAAARVAPVALAVERRKATAIEANVAFTRQRNDALRKRINQVLMRATGFENDDADLWATLYSDFYGWSAPEKSPVVRRQNFWEHQAYYTLPRATQSRRDESTDAAARPRTTTPPAPVRPPPRGPMIGIVRGYFEQFAGECFASGTPVLTLRGRLPIEEIEPGDEVLSQDIETGELAYKTVQRRTLRRGAPLVKISLGAKYVVATPGHPFFVVGVGWKVAKQLREGDRLSGLHGTATVKGLAELPTQEVYNLVVNDFSTFFVGQQQLLVHDDVPLAPTTALVPGLVATTAP